MEKPILRIEGVKKRQGGGFSLDIPRLEFQKGGAYSITGPNGSGKTTLLNILNLLERPDDGDIFFYEGKVTTFNSLDIRRKMGMVMENPYLFHTTVYKNMALGLKCRFVDRMIWKSQVEEALRMVGLRDFEKRYAPDLSRGESQRVAIARILAFRPEVLFLDEPFSNIDRKHVNLLEGLIKAIIEKYQTTVIFTTHDLAQAQRLADETISLMDGRIVAEPIGGA
ncbi:MAG: ATP-binding cassette domain-containing protein [Deltaproteobacteria bacterium]|mgnify:CR=1 FL=1